MNVMNLIMTDNKHTFTTLEMLNKGASALLSAISTVVNRVNVLVVVGFVP